MQATSRAAMPNFSQSRNTCLRSAKSRPFSKASSAKAPHSISPSVKPPCRLAHTSMAASNTGSGARRSSTARASPATHSNMKGKANANGRARKCEVIMVKAAAVNSSAGKGRRSLISRRSGIAEVAAKAAALNATTPPHPPAAKASAIRTCDSHSPGDQGLAREGIGVAIGVGHAAVVEDPAADGHVPLAVGIHQQRLAGCIGKHPENDQPDHERQ